jgi:hypothetical protein
MGENVSPEVQKRADAESFRINLEHARKLDEDDARSRTKKATDGKPEA